MKKKISIIAALIFILAVGLIGCGSEKQGKLEENPEKRFKQEKPKEDKADKKLEKITVLVPDYAVPSDKLVDEFKEKYKIKPEFEKINWSKISEAVENGDIKSDVVQVDWTLVGRYKYLDLISPVKTSEDEEKDMPSLEAFKINGEIYAKPYFNDFKLAFYNEKQYERAGIDEPPKTWDKMYQNSEKLKAEDIVVYPFLTALNDTYDSAIDFLTLMFARNGKIFDEDGRLYKEGARNTLEFIKMMYDRGLIAPAKQEIYLSDDYRKIATGETSFMIGASSYIVGLNDRTKSSIAGQVKDTRIPGIDDYTESVLSCPEGLAVMKSSKKKEAAQKYIDWFTSEETQKKLFDSSNIIPSRLNVLEDIISSGDIKSTGAMIETARIATTPIPDLDKTIFREILDIVSYSLYHMAVDNKSVDETAEYMDQTISSVLAGEPVPDEVKEAEE